MAGSDEKLTTYRKKRDFAKTPEPSGEKKASQTQPIFVIQKHDATSLHYDLRLEVNGVLKSWAVPKGPSLDPHLHRLAMQTEDHPYDYALFEGVIPEGNYGAGAVMVWDIGRYENTTHTPHNIPIEEGIEQGHATFILHGQKLHGRFALIRTGKEKSGKARWLLIKMKEDVGAPPYPDPVVEQPNSVISGRSIDEIYQDASQQKAA